MHVSQNAMNIFKAFIIIFSTTAASFSETVSYQTEEENPLKYKLILNFPVSYSFDYVTSVRPGFSAEYFLNKAVSFRTAYDHGINLKSNTEITNFKWDIVMASIGIPKIKEKQQIFRTGISSYSVDVGSGTSTTTYSGFSIPLKQYVVNGIGAGLTYSMMPTILTSDTTFLRDSVTSADRLQGSLFEACFGIITKKKIYSVLNFGNSQKKTVIRLHSSRFIGLTYGLGGDMPGFKWGTAPHIGVRCWWEGALPVFPHIAFNFDFAMRAAFYNTKRENLNHGFDDQFTAGAPSAYIKLGLGFVPWLKI